MRAYHSLTSRLTAGSSSLLLAATVVMAGVALPSRTEALPSEAKATKNNGLTSIREELTVLVRDHPRTKAEAQRLAAALSRSRYRNWYYPDPTIGYMLMNAPYKKDPADLSPRTFRQSELMISQAIPTPGRLSLESDVSDLEAKKARLRLIAVGNDLAATYLRDRVRLWRSGHHRDLSRIYLGRFQPILSISGAQYALGKGGLADLAMARLSSRNLEEKFTRYTKESESAKAALEYYGVGARAFEENDITELNAYAREVLQAALADPGTAADRSPEVALAGLDTGISSKRKTLARLEYMPDFTLFAKYYRTLPGNQPVPGVPLADNQLNLGFTMRVPLWSAMNNHNNVDETEHARAAADFDQANLVRETNAAKETLLLDIKGLKERISLYQTRLIPEAERAVLSAREGYQTGRGDFNSLLRVWESLYGLEMEAVNLQADRLERIFALGRLVNVIQPNVIETLNHQPSPQKTGETP